MTSALPSVGLRVLTSVRLSNGQETLLTFSLLETN